MIFALDIMGVLLTFWRKNHLNGDGVFRGHKTRDGLEPEIIHTAYEPSGRINSMNQHFWLQNIKIYHENNKKCYFAKYSSLHEAFYQPMSTNFLDDIFIFVSSKNWC